MHRLSLASAYDLAGETSGARLISIVVENVGQIGFIEGVEQIGGGASTSTVHPHVE